MDENPTDLSVKKENLYKELLDLHIKGLDEGLFTSVEESQESAKFIVDGMDKITTDQQIKPFIEDLASRWPAYKGAIMTIAEEEQKNKDQQKIDTVENELDKLADTPQAQ